MSLHQQTQCRLEESTRQVIQDALNEKRSEIDFADARYLLRIGESKKAILYFFDPDVTRCTQDIEIEYLRNRHCMIFAAKEAIYRILILGKKAIQLYRCKISQQGTIKSDFEKFTYSISLEKDAELVYLSPSIELGEKEYHIAYSNKDEFYLVVLTFANKQYSVDLLKLKDLDERKGMLSWFSRSEREHYQNVRLMLAKGENENQIRVVSVRDKQLMIHEVDLKYQVQKSTIRVAKVLNSFSEQLKGDQKLSNVLFVQSTPELSFFHEISLKLFALYRQESNIYSIIKVNVTFSNGELEIELSQTVPFRAKYCQLIWFKNSFFLTSCQEFERREEYSVYQISEQDLMSLNEELSFQSKALVRQTEKVVLSRKTSSLLVVSPLRISQLASGTVEFNMIDDCEKGYKARIHKHIQLQEYKDISDIFEQEYRQLLQQTNNDDKNMDKQDFAPKIVCIFLMKKILRSNFIQKIKEHEDGVMMLKECCQNLTENNVENLLNIMTELKIYNFFVNDLLHSIVFEFLMSKEDNMNIDDRVWKKTIRSLTLESIRNIVRDLGTKESLTNVDNRTLYNILITQMSEFSSDSEVTPEMLAILLPYEPKQIKNIIMTKHLSRAFVRFFSQGDLAFDHQELNEMARHIYVNKRQEFQAFVKNLLRRCLREWKNNKDMDTITIKSQVIVKGLLEFSDIVLPHLKSTFPGLAYLFYLKENTRKLKSKEISELAIKTECPKTSYIMNLSVLDCYKDYSYPLLATNKLALELKKNNLSAEDLIRSLKESEEKEIEVSRQTWQEWKQTMKKNKEDIQQIERKLKLID